MEQTRSHSDRLLELVSSTASIRSRDLKAHGIPRVYLTRLVRRGLLRRLGHILYGRDDAPAAEHQTLAEATKRVPQGVICLLSALRFHGLTTQSPHEVWVAIPHKAWAPRPDDGPPIRILRMSRHALESGVERHRIGGVEIKVFGPAKTIADCFKFRNKIGLDVALEALADYRRAYPGGTDELWRYAKIDRVASVIRPYFEALT